MTFRRIRLRTLSFSSLSCGLGVILFITHKINLSNSDHRASIRENNLFFDDLLDLTPWISHSWAPKSSEVFSRIPPIFINGDSDSFYRSVATLQVTLRTPRGPPEDPNSNPRGLTLRANESIPDTLCDPPGQPALNPKP